MIVGNPPFLGGKRISTVFGDEYRDWLVQIHEESNSNADLVVHFFSDLVGQGSGIDADGSRPIPYGRMGEKDELVMEQGNILCPAVAAPAQEQAEGPAQDPEAGALPARTVERRSDPALCDGVAGGELVAEAEDPDLLSGGRVAGQRE